QVDQRFRFLGEVAKAEDQADRSVHGKGEGEKQKERILRLAPEAQKEQHRHEGCHGDGAVQDRLDVAHESESQMRPNSKTIMEMSATRVRATERSPSGSATLSITSSRLLRVRPAKQSPLQSSRR